MIKYIKDIDEIHKVTYRVSKNRFTAYSNTSPKGRGTVRFICSLNSKANITIAITPANFCCRQRKQPYRGKLANVSRRGRGRGQQAQS